MTDVFPRKITRSTKIYMKEGIIVKAAPPKSVSTRIFHQYPIAHPYPWGRLTTEEQRQRRQGTELGLEPFHQGRQGENVQDGVKEVEVDERERIKSVHCSTNGALLEKYSFVSSLLFHHLFPYPLLYVCKPSTPHRQQQSFG